MAKKIEYVLGLENEQSGHTLGVNSLVFNADHPLGLPRTDNGDLPAAHQRRGVLFSGGSDGRVNAWAAVPTSGSHFTMRSIASDSLHTNWVNDLLCYQSLIFSCSSDTTVKLWDPHSGRSSIVGNHTDYAKCLASYSTTDPEWIVSGGLDGRILGWKTDNIGSGVPAFDFKIAGDEGSVYSLDASLGASSASGTSGIIASGSPDSIVRLWDPRTPTAVSRLLGHTDNIRSIVIRDQWLVSASSDSTMIVWNLVSGRLFRKYTQYGTSVWSLEAADDKLDTFYCGDRQGIVLKTDRESGQSILVATENRGITSIAQGYGEIWTATSERALRGWADTNNWSNSIPADALVSPENTPRVNPVAEMKGGVSLVGYRLLDDKRRVLVGRSDGNVALVDLIQGKALPSSLPNIDLSKDIADELDAIAEGVNTLDVLENWCHVSIKAGQLCVTLDERSHSNTEVYADDLAAETGLDLGVVNDERRLNVGKWMLHNLMHEFRNVKFRQYHELVEKGELQAQHRREADATVRAADASVEGPMHDTKPKLMSRLFGFRKSKDDPGEKPTSAPAHSNGAHSAGANGELKTETDTGTGGQNDPAYENFEQLFSSVVEEKSLVTDLDEFPRIQIAQDTRVLISESVPGAGAPTDIFQARVGDLGRPENVAELERLLPVWVGQTILLGKANARTPTRVSFSVVPIEGSKAPIISNDKTRLMAHPVLRARKIMSYTVGQLKTSGHLSENDADRPPQELIELYCKEVKIDPRMPLAMIRTRIWRSGGDVIFHYRMLDVAAAPVPQNGDAPQVGAKNPVAMAQSQPVS